MGGEADLCVVNVVTATTPLSDEEIDELVRYTEGGGTLLLNVFSQWNLTGTDLNQRLGAAFGVRPVPHGDFGPKCSCPLMTHSHATDLVPGPFGCSTRWVNVGSTPFHIMEGAQALTIQLARNLHYQPLLGKGRVLICSNFHWRLSRKAGMAAPFTKARTSSSCLTLLR